MGNDSKFLVLSFILFVVATGYNIQAYSRIGSVIMVAFSAVIVSYLISYGLSDRFNSLKIISSASLVMSVVLFLLATYTIASTQSLLVNYLSFAEALVVFVLVLLFLFSVLQIYFYTRNWKVRLAVIAIAVALVATYFFHGFLHYHVDDELLLSYFNTKALLAGTNPYAMSFSQQLSVPSNDTGVTLNTNGSVIGVMDYPFLYFLVQAPFYFLIHSTKQIAGTYMSSEGFIFTLLLLFSYMLIAGKIKDARPNYLFYISLGLFNLDLPSMIIFLMLALVILLYSDIGRKYEWLILGLAVSLQEQLWFMALLFIAYSANTYGKERGIRNLLGALLIFMIFNGYFIAINPSAYLHNFLQVTSTPYPNSISTIGYLLASGPGIAINSFNYLFAISMASVLLVSLYVNNRKIIPLLSTIPFLFMGHALAMYYLLPISAFALVANIPIKEGQANRLSALMGKKTALKAAYLLVLLALVIAMVHVASAAQQSYLNNLGLKAENIGLGDLNQTNFTYHADLLYNKNTKSDLYLMIEANSNGSSSFFGVFNSSIIKDSMKCGFPCSVNVNLIRLNGSGIYNLTAYIPSNTTKPTYLTMILSNGDYYYQAPAIRYG